MSCAVEERKRECWREGKGENSVQNRGPMTDHVLQPVKDSLSLDPLYIKLGSSRDRWHAWSFISKGRHVLPNPMHPFKRIIYYWAPPPCPPPPLIIQQFEKNIKRRWSLSYIAHEQKFWLSGEGRNEPRGRRKRNGKRNGWKGSGHPVGTDLPV